MNIVFMGTPEFAMPALEALASEHTITSVFTRPDAVSGRGKTLLPSPVRRRAEELGITVHTPRDFYLRDAQGRDMLNVREQRPLNAEQLALLVAGQPDIIVVAAYGVVLPAAVLEAAPLGTVTIHASLLPRWRGAAPIERAILAGDAQAGVSIMRVTKSLDAGPYCARASTEVAQKDATSLSAELAQLGAELLLEQLPLIASGRARWTEQDPALVTYADKLLKEELWISPALSVEDNLRRVRSASRRLPARCRIADREVAVLAASPLCPATPQLAVPTAAPAGAVLLHNRRLLLACADGLLEVCRLKPAGKQAMDVPAFINGLPEHKGDVLSCEHKGDVLSCAPHGEH
ncbi:MAG: methionyl-tRNA formyltransferase, partial [Coriobacteriales bacterium]|nr:methionyl-tRNA formyltransferase [Coriobacteriales bacterium]